jgi:hypothetical protein
MSMAASLANRFARTYETLEDLNAQLGDRVRAQTIALEERRQPTSSSRTRAHQRPPFAPGGLLYRRPDSAAPNDRGPGTDVGEAPPRAEPQGAFASAPPLQMPAIGWASAAWPGGGTP